MSGEMASSRRGSTNAGNAYAPARVAASHATTAVDSRSQRVPPSPENASANVRTVVAGLVSRAIEKNGLCRKGSGADGASLNSAGGAGAACGNGSGRDLPASHSRMPAGVASATVELFGETANAVTTPGR